MTTRLTVQDTHTLNLNGDSPVFVPPKFRLYPLLPESEILTAKHYHQY